MNAPRVPEGFLEVGRIGKPHGVKGDVFVTLTSDVEERRRIGACFVVTSGSERRTLEIASIRPQADRFVVHFVGVDDRTGAEHLTNTFLYAEPVADDGALWVHQLVGSHVIDVDGRDWGRCVAVVENPAHHILELDDGMLVPVPFVESCDGTTTVIRPPEGLREALKPE